MPAPYGLEIVDNCATCAWKKDGFFCQLSAPAVKSFEEVKFTSSYPANAVLFVEGQVPRGVYLLCKGRVKLTMTSSDGKSIILHVAEAGELIGLQGAISGKAYEVSAETLEPCQVNFIKREAFERLMRDHRDIGAHVTGQFSNDYQAACVQIRSLGLSRTAEEKVARFLLECATSRARDQSGNSHERGPDARGNRAGRGRLSRDRYAHPERLPAEVVDHHQGAQRIDSEQARPRGARRSLTAAGRLAEALYVAANSLVATTIRGSLTRSSTNPALAAIFCIPKFSATMKATRRTTFSWRATSTRRCKIAAPTPRR